MQLLRKLIILMEGLVQCEVYEVKHHTVDKKTPCVIIPY